jgi:hypothetical protein
MSAKCVLATLAISIVGCAPLLDASFNALPGGALGNGVVNLPGSPNGDDMVVSNQGASITIESGLFAQQHLRIPTGTSPPGVTFRPVRGNSDRRIFISYDALISGSSARGRIVFHNLDERGNADDIPDMTLDFFRADAQQGEAPVTATGWKMNSVVGKHSVVLSISPDGASYTATVAGDEVTNSPMIFEFASIDGGWHATPPNFEITITTDPDGGAGSYQIDDLLITEN